MWPNWVGRWRSDISAGMPIFSRSAFSNAPTSRLGPAGRGGLVVERLLVGQRGHLGAGLLGGPCEVVAVKERLVVTDADFRLPDADDGVPELVILALGEGDAEQAGGAVEGGLDHVVEL